ncbi:hypothetical protein MPTK1_2g00700 [Marchantia polymorpha subsp. ruderalis]|uniref:Uncharacterized protein n=1 Tax=Marchantia polymorpha TaxID=3197 RepID=A0A2R6X9I6_MARPO|nr:hypothetical protein MARPO_0028s0081 [Marchantia polymorpha]BBN00629.1 hypothetical protein Mp_2g00700 [Marchantia polymorpha subsp. ruderalis]|eukprot:PTQ42768.1 hypothetical protein MARPO_0028s0081 [Marchantia polymorpha]
MDDSIDKGQVFFRRPRKSCLCVCAAGPSKPGLMKPCQRTSDETDNSRTHTHEHEHTRRLHPGTGTLCPASGSLQAVPKRVQERSPPLVLPVALRFPAERTNELDGRVGEGTLG